MMDVEREKDRLEAMTTDQLRDRYAEVWEHEPRTRHKQYLGAPSTAARCTRCSQTPPTSVR